MVQSVRADASKMSLSEFRDWLVEHDFETDAMEEAVSKAHRKVAFIACSATKLDSPALAREMYQGSLFKKSKEFIQSSVDDWFILSAKYGLLSPDQQIEPYEQTLNNMSKSEREAWGKAVLKQLEGRLKKGDQLYFLCGERYYEEISSALSDMGYEIKFPLRGLGGIGYQLQWLGESDPSEVFVSKRDMEKAVPEKYKHIDFNPPKMVQENARRALEVRETKPPSQRGMTPVGLARARDLMNARVLSPETVRRMLNYFTRHEVDKKGSSWGEQGKGWQAWMGWGGDEGFRWARKIVNQMNRADEAEKRED
jgi:hypothetical protein